MMLRVTFLLAFSLMICGIIAAQPMDLEGEYIDAVSSYYEVESGYVKTLAGEDLGSVDIAVVYGVAQRSGLAASEVAAMYREKKSWAEVAGECELGAVDFYILISGKVTSKTFAPTFAKYSGMEPHLWKSLTLTDQEIVDLVNLRILASHHDYSIFDIMAMRDYGSSWSRINQKVGLAKKSLLEKMAKDTL